MHDNTILSHNTFHLFSQDTRKSHLQTAERVKVAMPSLKTMDQNCSERGDKTRGFSPANLLRPLKIFIMTRSDGFNRQLSVCQSFDYDPGSDVRGKGKSYRPRPPGATNYPFLVAARGGKNPYRAVLLFLMSNFLSKCGLFSLCRVPICTRSRTCNISMLMCAVIKRFQE